MGTACASITAPEIRLSPPKTTDRTQNPDTTAHDAPKGAKIHGRASYATGPAGEGRARVGLGHSNLKPQFGPERLAVELADHCLGQLLADHHLIDPLMLADPGIEPVLQLIAGG